MSSTHAIHSSVLVIWNRRLREVTRGKIQRAVPKSLFRWGACSPGWQHDPPCTNYAIHMLHLLYTHTRELETFSRAKPKPGCQSHKSRMPWFVKQQQGKGVRDTRVPEDVELCFKGWKMYRRGQEEKSVAKWSGYAGPIGQKQFNSIWLPPAHLASSKM